MNFFYRHLKPDETENSDEIFNNKIYFPDLPDGALTAYRRKATFNYRKLALLIETEESYRLKVRI